MQMHSALVETGAQCMDRFVCKLFVKAGQAWEQDFPLFKVFFRFVFQQSSLKAGFGASDPFRERGSTRESIADIKSVFRQQQKITGIVARLAFFQKKIDIHAETVRFTENENVDRRPAPPDGGIDFFEITPGEGIISEPLEFIPERSAFQNIYCPSQGKFQ